ncbi:putative olfactory receptor 52P1 [Trichosurus vulpecula]|uniref:putative olfactory receptor 52P1 n=1 Tax=Trichosurus vulpecula TaxID=9337 RepID=UPI00186AFCC0|nr:putative olfactory receptor 52P1 [Trichosurus vulpecula]
MTLYNHSHVSPTTFILMGIPGLEVSHFWIAFPFCSMYVMAVLGNLVVLLVVWTEPGLHQPMYLFLCMLSAIDLVLCTSTVPRLLALFWAGTAEITFGACATQMFFIHGFSAVESGILLAMAIDRYVAICRPLRYGTLLPLGTVGCMGLAAVFRGLGLMTPLTCLLARLHYCGQVIAHSYCEHMAVVKLACDDTRANNVYGITAATLVVGTDSICIALSYALILRAVLALSSKEARAKTFGTCGSHLGVILLFYTPGLFSFYTQRFGQHVPRHVHILLADLYLVVPPMLNPIIYGMKTKQIRDGALRLLQKGPVQA